MRHPSSKSSRSFAATALRRANDLFVSPSKQALGRPDGDAIVAIREATEWRGLLQPICCRKPRMVRSCVEPWVGIPDRHSSHVEGTVASKAGKSTFASPRREAGVHEKRCGPPDSGEPHLFEFLREPCGHRPPRFWLGMPITDRAWPGAGSHPVAACSPWFRGRSSVHWSRL